MKQTIFHKTKKGKVIKCTYTKGVNIGDYFFIVRDNLDNFLDRLGNRSFQQAIDLIS